MAGLTYGQREDLRMWIERGMLHAPYLELALNEIDERERRAAAIVPILENYVRLDCNCKLGQKCFPCVARDEFKKLGLEIKPV
jgi:hypothetical protein